MTTAPRTLLFLAIRNARLAAQSGFPSGEAHPDARRPQVLHGGTPCAIPTIPVAPGD
jgi:hypothetical protein